MPNKAEGKRSCGMHITAIGQMTEHSAVPAAGNRNGTSTNNVGSNGNYWSSSLNTSNSNNAYNLNFNSGKVDWNNNNRNNGQSVRAVSEFTICKGLLPFAISFNQLLLDLYRAYKDARRHKRYKLYQLDFELNLESNLISLANEIYEQRYFPGVSTCFIIHEPKMREVFAASFRDRIVHHLLYNYVYPVFVKQFITDSYSCIKGRGTLFGIIRLKDAIAECSNNYSKSCYVLKLDIKGYFMRINRLKLLAFCREMLDEGKQKAGYTEKGPDLQLVNYLMDCNALLNPTKKCIVLGNKAEWKHLPADKSLFRSPSGCGLPIGNLTSQLFSNVYLHKLDAFCTQTLGCRNYGRYVDDFYIVGNSKAELRPLIPLIRNYLSYELGLELNERKIQVYSAYRGVPFLGAFLKPFRGYLENRSLRRMLVKIRTLNYEGKDNIWHSLNSYLGCTSHNRAFNLRKDAIVNNVPTAFLFGYFGKSFLTYKLW